MFMIDDALDEFAAQYVLIPGQRLSVQESLSAIGFHAPLPHALDQLIKSTDQLGHHSLVLTERDPLLVQWNPFMGVTPLLTEFALGVAGFSDHRWLQSIHESGIKALFHQIHESVHAQWAAFGLSGGLSLCSQSHRALFHSLAEACAVYIGDIEAPELLRREEVFKDYWPAGAYRSHAIAFCPLEALAESGLIAEKRAEWLMNLYLSGERTFPKLPNERGLRAEALAFLIEEGSYADKIDLTTTPQWLRYYWDRPEIEAFMKDFVRSVSPIRLSLAHHKEISTTEDLREQWRVISYGEWFDPDRENYLKSRLMIQRYALKVAELIGVFKSYRLPIDPTLSQTALKLLNHTRDQLLSCLLSHCADSPLSDEITPAQLMSFDAQAVTEQVSEFMCSLIEGLIELCGPILIIDHPLLDGIPFGDHSAIQHLIKLEETEIGERLKLLKLIRSECRSSITQLVGEQSINPAIHNYLQEILEQSRAIFRRAQRLIGEINIESNLDSLKILSSECDLFFEELIDHRNLHLCYPLSWVQAAPFIDPLIGFRYR